MARVIRLLVLAGLFRGRQVSGTPSEEAYDKPAGQGPVCKQHSAVTHQV